MPIVELGHIGLYVENLEQSQRFYRDALGLIRTDGDEEAGVVFLSSRPEVEHHELALVARREGEGSAGRVNQVSWRVDTLEELLAIRRRILDSGATVQQEVTHGNAIGMYFFDPDGNRLEIYWPTGIDTPQPFKVPIALDQPADNVLRDLAGILNPTAR